MTKHTFNQAQGVALREPPATWSEALPPWLVLEPLSRRPLRLREETARHVMAAPIPDRVVPAQSIGEQSARLRASIVVVTFNQLVCTKMCLASVLTNTEYPNYEVIVVDNASTDETRRYLRELADHHPHVRVVCNEQNRGFAPANNQGLALATGDVLVLLNNDTVVTPGWLTRLIQHLEDPTIGSVGPVTNRICNEAQIEAPYGTYAGLVGFASARMLAEHGKLFDIRMLAMYCMAMRRDVYERVGAIDEQFAVGMLEDDDYAMRVRAAGYRVVCAEDVFVHHFSKASFGELVPTGEYGELLRTNRARWEAKWSEPWQPYRQRTNPRYDQLVERVRQVVDGSVPLGATVLVVSKGDDALLDLPGRQGWHFPRTEEGGYSGYHPSDSAAAIAHLEDQRAKGAHYFLIPAAAFWWLEHYAEFAHYLQRRFLRVTARDDNCLIFALDDRTIAATLGRQSGHHRRTGAGGDSFEASGKRSVD